MKSIAEAAASGEPNPVARGRLAGLLRMLVSGDDATAWQTSEGDPVPWSNRPRLLCLAIEQWRAEPEWKLRSCLRYVISQQTNSYPLPRAGDGQGRSPPRRRRGKPKDAEFDYSNPTEGEVKWKK